MGPKGAQRDHPISRACLAPRTRRRRTSPRSTSPLRIEWATVTRISSSRGFASNLISHPRLDGTEMRRVLVTEPRLDKQMPDSTATRLAKYLREHPDASTLSMSISPRRSAALRQYVRQILPGRNGGRHRGNVSNGRAGESKVSQTRARRRHDPRTNRSRCRSAPTHRRQTLEIIGAARSGSPSDVAARKGASKLRTAEESPQGSHRRMATEKPGAHTRNSPGAATPLASSRAAPRAMCGVRHVISMDERPQAAPASPRDEARLLNCVRDAHQPSNRTNS